MGQPSPNPPFPSNPPPPPLAKGLALVAMLGVLAFFGLVVALHFLRPDYDPLQRYISEYAVGPYGYLQVLGFLSLGIGSIALALGIQQLLGRELDPWTPRLLAFWGAGMALLGVFTTNLKGMPKTPVGRIHDNLSIVILICLLVAMARFARALRTAPNWRRFNPRGFPLILGLCAMVFKLAQWPPVGLVERVVAILLLLWLFLTALTLFRTAPSPRERTVPDTTP